MTPSANFIGIAIALVILMALGYFAASFLALSFNPLAWHGGVRLLATVWAFFVFFTVIEKA
jgi:hypothetical protein